MEGGETPAVLTSLLALSELSAAVHLSVKNASTPTAERIIYSVLQSQGGEGKEAGMLPYS